MKTQFRLIWIEIWSVSYWFISSIFDFKFGELNSLKEFAQRNLEGYYIYLERFSVAINTLKLK